MMQVQQHSTTKYAIPYARTHPIVLFRKPVTGRQEFFQQTGSNKAFILCRSGLKRGVYVLPSYEPQSRYHNLKFQLDTKCASGKPLVVHCTSDPDELETCNLLQNPPKTSINSLQLKLRRPTNNQKELKVSLGHDSAGEGATINNVNKYITGHFIAISI